MGQLRQSEGRRMQLAINVSLMKDHAACTAQIGRLIVIELAVGNVHEAFRHLKGLVPGGLGDTGEALFLDHGTADGGACQALPAA